MNIDREMISNYGWIVIVTIILALMMAFATSEENLKNKKVYGKNYTGTTQVVVDPSKF